MILVLGLKKQFNGTKKMSGGGKKLNLEITKNITKNNMVIDNIIGTGLSGLVGSRIVELLSPAISFEDVSRKTGTDITNAQAVLDRFSSSSAPIILHLAAKTDV